MMSDVAISLIGVSKTYRIYNKPADRLKQSLRRGKQYFREHQALLPLSLEVKRGHTVGVIGCNGSGKSTLLQIIAGTLNASSGEVNVNGRISALLELGAGFNPAFSGHDNIYLSGSIMGLSKAEIADKYDEIIAFSGLKAEAIAQAVSTYSSGMYVRLAFATAIAVNPDILIVDEALAVGDEGFQRKCFARIRELQEAGATIFFVSHSGRAIIDLCDHAILLDAGELLMQGSPANVVASYHNMLFAPESEKPNIRAQIKAQQSNATAPTAPIIKHTKSDAPETQIIYPEDGGKISNWGAFDEAGNPALIWEIGKNYSLEYELEITKPISNLRCSMMIKTITGIELAGALWKGEQAQYQAGDKLKIRFNIPCKFSKGDYFINIGAVEEQFGTYRFINRIVDALHIKVVEGVNENAKIQPTGLIDAGINADGAHFD
jgi:lipopolysaccharide transport system ATP-binding protein